MPIPNYIKYVLPPIHTSIGQLRFYLLRGTKTFAQAAADTCILTAPSGFWGDSEPVLAESLISNEGRRVFDSIEFPFIDFWEAAGVVDGSPVAMDFRPEYSSLRVHLFGDKSIKYRFVVTLFNGTDEELVYIGDGDARKISAEEGPFLAPHEGTEIKREVYTFPTVAAAIALEQVTIADIKTAVLASPDLVNEDMYSGISASPGLEKAEVHPYNLHGGRWTNVDRRYFRPAVFHAQRRGESDPYKYLFNDFRQTGYSATANFNWGTKAIPLGALIELICTAAEIDFDPATDLDGSLEFLKQRYEAADHTWPFDGVVSLADLYVPINAFFGLHPFDGSDWDNPARIAEDETGLTLIKYIANAIVATADIELDGTTYTPRLIFRPFEYDAGTCPASVTSKIREGATREEVSIGPAKVGVQHVGDETVVLAPRGAVGDGKLDVKQLFRIKLFGPPGVHPGSTSENWEYHNLGAFALAIHDAGKPLGEQWRNHYVGSTGGDASPYEVPAGECWIPFTYLYWRKTATANDMYPAGYLIPTGGSWAGLYSIGAVIRKGATPPTTDISPKQINLLEYPAAIFARRFTGERTVFVREYNEVRGADGTIRSLRPGLRDTWLTDGEQTEKAISSLRRRIRARISEIRWESVGTLPEVDEILTEEESESSSSSSSTSTSSSSKTTVVVTTNGGDTPHRATKRTVKFLSGGIVSKTLEMTIFESWDAAAEIWIAQYGMSAPHDEAEVGLSETYGYNSFWLFNKLGTEAANVWIEGLDADPVGTPTASYFASAITMRKRNSGADTNMDRLAEQMFWSEDQNRFLIQRQLEKCNPRRRVYIDGRIKLERVGPALVPSWVSLSNDANWPHSDREILDNSDHDDVAALNPTLAIVTHALRITWPGLRFKPVSVHALAWMFDTAFIPNVNNGAGGFFYTSQIGAAPVVNQLYLGAGPTQLDVFFWLNDFTFTPPRHYPVASMTQVLGVITTGNVLYVDVWGQVEVIGEDADVA